MTTVLVVDGENKNALAAVRSLGQAGLRVISAASRRLTRSAMSRYADRGVVYPSHEDEGAFVAGIRELIEQYRIDVVLPIGDASFRIFSKHKDTFDPVVAIPVAEWPAMSIASDKRASIPFAQRLGIPTPTTYSSKSDVDRFPVVAKAGLGAGGVRYVNSPDELERFDTEGSVLQEYIPGDGYGFFALFEHGKERAIFMHRRIREYPITGGASTAAESVYDERLRSLGVALLRALDWHGVAMVEFKRDDRDGAYKLMEINPKFWGSLDLAIASGVDFPRLAVEMALGQLEEDVMNYPSGVRFQWVFDDLVRLAADPRSFRQVIYDLRKRTKNDLLISDPKPAIYDGARAIGTVIGRAATGRLRHPHGAPELTASDLAADLGASQDLRSARRD